MKIEFINLNHDSKLDPEIKLIPMSSDSENMPPSYCMPWVEASRYSVLLKSNFEYWIRKEKDQIFATAVVNGSPVPVQSIELEVPRGIDPIYKDETEEKNQRIHISHTPAFSSPWQKKMADSITLKLGICWYTPPAFGLYICAAPHRNSDFKIVEGFVRTDLWHRDLPIIIQPLKNEIKISKYAVIAAAIPVQAEDIELQDVSQDVEKIKTVIHQVSHKRLNPSVYKILATKK